MREPIMLEAAMAIEALAQGMDRLTMLPLIRRLRETGAVLQEETQIEVDKNIDATVKRVLDIIVDRANRVRSCYQFGSIAEGATIHVASEITSAIFEEYDV